MFRETSVFGHLEWKVNERLGHDAVQVEEPIGRHRSTLRLSHFADVFAALQFKLTLDSSSVVIVIVENSIEEHLQSSQPTEPGSGRQLFGVELRGEAQ